MESVVSKTISNHGAQAGCIKIKDRISLGLKTNLSSLNSPKIVCPQFGENVSQRILNSPVKLWEIQVPLICPHPRRRHPTRANLSPWHPWSLSPGAIPSILLLFSIPLPPQQLDFTLSLSHRCKKTQLPET